MEIEIILDRLQLTLYGYRGPIHDGKVAESAMPLMDRMWRTVKERGIQTKGINHWVYLPDSMVFTGVELQGTAVATPADTLADSATLESLDVSIDRYVKYVHVGPYSALGATWRRLLDEVKRRGEQPQYPHLEIYGHWNADETKCETEIVIGLRGNCA